ncbi:MAG: DUF4214 domain-containing protein [Thermoanaerobaculia bacterium]
MRHTSKAIQRSAFTFLFLLVLVPLHGAWAQTACTFSTGGCQCDCGGLTSLPAQNPSPRSYDSFVIKAYQGALGRTPTCTERRAEYWNLLDASYSSSSLLEEAKRFVSTLIETQTSYDIHSIDPSTYTQTPAYEQRNPAANMDRMSLEAFTGDLYKSFLQRSPDLGGQCFWTNNVCSQGRKKGIEAFKVSAEFANLANGLFDSGEPCVIIRNCDPRTGFCTQ